jgi:arabinose-5-phosphate isomerase
MKPNKDDLIKWALDVIETEARAVSNLSSCIDTQFVDACNLILECTGKLVVTGLGKSGHISKKIAATFASTGTPAFYMHPAEAIHGDIGMLAKNDVVLAISYSGGTEEILAILPALKRMNIPLVAFSGSTKSKLALLSDIHIHVKVDKEACSLGLAPTASTTATLAMGDAMAIALLQAKGFTKEDFARSHPGGKLGKTLLVRIKDIMHKGTNIPKVYEHTTIKDAIIEMSKKKLGMTAVVDTNNTNKITGIFSDGDLRRALNKNIDIHNTKMTDVMTKSFITIHLEELATKAIGLMEQHKIFMFPVINDQNELVGAFNMHDLFMAGVV